MAKKAASNGQHKKVAEQTIEKTLDRVAGRGITGKGVDQTEIELDRLQQIVERTKTTCYYALTYDIPTHLEKECPNPSCILWFYGFRFNKSMWILPEESIECEEVQELLQHWAEFPEVDPHVLPWAERANERIREIALDRLVKKLQQTHTSLITRIAAADERYHEAELEWEKRLEEGGEVTSAETDKAEEKWDTNMRVLLKECGEALNGAIACAERFDLTNDVKDMCQGIREAIAAETKAFNAYMRAKGAKGSKLAPEVE